MTDTGSADDGRAADEAVAEAVGTLGEVYPSDDLVEGDANVESLAAALTSPDAALRRDAAQLLCMLAERFPDTVVAVVADLIDALDAPDDETRVHCLRGLGYVSKSHPEAVQPAVDRLVELLDDDVVLVRNATWTLANVAEFDPPTVEPAVERFVALLHHGDDEVHRHAARGIGFAAEAYPEEARAARDRLLELLESTALYRAVGRALVSAAPVCGESLVDRLLERLDAGRPTVREHVSWTLVPLADDHPELLRPHWRALHEIAVADDDYQVQNSAAAALAALASDRPEADLVGALVELLEHDDPFVRRFGCLALGDVAMATRKEAVLRALDGALDDPMDVISDLAEQRLVEVATEHPDEVAGVRPELLARVDPED